MNLITIHNKITLTIGIFGIKPLELPFSILIGTHYSEEVMHKTCTNLYVVLDEYTSRILAIRDEK